MGEPDTTLDRRGFFRQLGQRAGRLAIEQADKRATRRAINWIRPPWAAPELDFLLLCTRCGNCIAACPHQVVFPLSARLGLGVGGTPALDLNNRGCHSCADWPCVTACRAGALRAPQDDNDAAPPAFPKLASARIDTRRCLAWQGPECGACASSCPIEGALIWKAEKPDIDAERCTGCGRCREACIVEPRAVVIRPLQPAS